MGEIYQYVIETKVIYWSDPNIHITKPYIPGQSMDRDKCYKYDNEFQ